MSRSAGSAHSDALVIFGITGDLAHKMTLPSLYHLEKRGLLSVPVVGVAANDMGDEDLWRMTRESVHAVLEKSGEQVDDTVLARLTSRMTYLGGDFTTLGGEQHPRLAALAAPPDATSLTPAPAWDADLAGGGVNALAVAAALGEPVHLRELTAHAGVGGACATSSWSGPAVSCEPSSQT